MDINISLAYIPMMTKLIMMDINVRRWMMKCLRWVRFMRVCAGGIGGSFEKLEFAKIEKKKK